jgi:hypothetical protein
LNSNHCNSRRRSLERVASLWIVATTMLAAGSAFAQAPSDPAVAQAPSDPAVAQAPSDPAVAQAPAGPALAQAPAGPALAQAPAPTAPAVSATVPAPAPAAPATPPPPYSLPWQLRPVVAANVIRSDTAVSFYENTPGASSSTVASTLLISYKVLPKLAPLVRLAYVHNNPDGPVGSGNAMVNPLVGALYQIDMAPGLRMGLFLGVTVPVGQGGDKAAAMDATAAAAASGVNARSAMDNALFAVNFLTVIPGFGIAYSRAGFTAQIEATVFQLTRVRNEDIEKDSKRTNFTSGFHMGYFVIPQLSLSGEMRFQRWLSKPSMLAMFPERRETITFAAGPRGHFKIGNRWIRPGIAYAQGLDAPMNKRKDRIIQIDVPFVF